MNIGIVGYGGVAKAFIELINEKENSLEHLNIDIKFILKSDGGIWSRDGLDINELCKGKDIKIYDEWNNDLNYVELLDENKIDLIIELTSTNIETGEPGNFYIREALKRGINVVTGNKGPILLYYNELLEIANKNNAVLGIGCTTGGALPSINVGTNDVAGSEVLEIQGILNGTSNYILMLMEKENLKYSEALKKAQNLGIAEANSDLDLLGYDTAIKTIILTNIIMKSKISLKESLIEGIVNIKIEDINKAKEKGKKLKLIGRAFKERGKTKVEVKVTEIDDQHPLYFVDGKNKGVYYSTDSLGDIVISGGASGIKNAAASILRDIINLSKKNH